jgi:hypothetical protein
MWPFTRKPEHTLHEPEPVHDPAALAAVLDALAAKPPAGPVDVSALMPPAPRAQPPRPRSWIDTNPDPDQLPGGNYTPTH